MSGVDPAAAFPPPPPPPGLPWSPPMVPPNLGMPRAGGAPPPIPLEGLERIRSSVVLYRWVPVLSVVLGVFIIAITLATGRFVGLGNLSPGGAFTPTPGPASLGVLLPVLFLTGIVGLATLIISLLSWLRWQQGLSEVERWFGWPPTHRPDALRSARRSFWACFVAFLVSLVGTGLLSAVLAFSSLPAPGSPAGSTVSAMIPLPEVLFSLVLSFLVTALAGLSLRASALPWSAPSSREALDQGCWAMVASGLVAVVPTLLLLSTGLTWAVVFVVAAPLVQIYGLTRLENGYRMEVAGPTRPVLAFRPR